MDSHWTPLTLRQIGSVAVMRSTWSEPTVEVLVGTPYGMVVVELLSGVRISVAVSELGTCSQYEVTFLWAVFR